MLSFKPVSRILCIDGVDGCGKGTITQLILKRLTEEGHSVAVIEPPFYNTNTGKAVSEYLTKGYGCIKDRRVASMLYSNDRNMYYREHFDEIFTSGKYDIVLYNRNWLSNIFFQTTVVCQSPEDTSVILGEPYKIQTHALGNFISASLPILHTFCSDVYRDLVDSKTLELLGTDAEGVQKLYEDHREQYTRLVDIYNDLRSQMVRQMVKLMYDTEIAPWGIVEDNVTYPFVDFSICRNVVLTPAANERCLKYVHDNLMKRYEGDATKMDRNEQSANYLLAVIENIHWIQKHFKEIFFQRRYSSTELGQYVITPEHNGIRWSLESWVKDEFQYRIIHTNKEPIEDQVEQRLIDEIADEVYHKLMEE
jgi:hypothetical protein